MIRGESNLTNLNQIILTEDRYFPVHKYGCGICSLANLIYTKFGDLETAKNIYLGARTHPLVGKDESTDILSFPFLLQELSNNKYSGICYLDTDTDYHLDELRLNSASSRDLEFAYEFSMKNKLLIFTKDYCVPYPNIIFLTDGNSGHALVCKEHSVFINNGHIEYSLPQGFEIDGLFKAFKK